MWPLVPKQGDGCNCGMFVLSYIECMAKGVQLSAQPFSGDDMAHLRSRMASWMVKIGVVKCPRKRRKWNEQVQQTGE